MVITINISDYIVYLQSEHIGTNVYDLILNEDHKDVKDALKRAEMDSMSRLQGMCMHICMHMLTQAVLPAFSSLYVNGFEEENFHCFCSFRKAMKVSPRNFHITE